MNIKKLSLIIVIIVCITAAAVFVPKLINQNQNIETAIDAKTARLRANLGQTFDGFAQNEANALRKKILNSKNTDELYEVVGVKYYISAEGDDNNDGYTPEKPIKTLERLNQIYLCPGDAVLFKRGDVFRFGETVKLKSNVIYGCYGEGVKPRIYGSPENYAQNDKWETETANVWKIPLTCDEACGLVINHSEIIGVKKIDDVSALKQNGDYLHDTEKGVFYLYCDQGNLCEVYKDIEIMPSTNILAAGVNKEKIVVDNLCIKYSSGFGITSTNTKNGFTVTNCEFGFLGGKWVNAQTKKLRYGNAVELWNGGKNVKIENNWFYQTYDSALSWQGNLGADYINISFSGNLFEYNNGDIEFFDRNGAKLENFVMKDNIMRFTSMGWGTRKNDGGIRGIEGCVRAVTGFRGKPELAMDVRSVLFENNIIDCPARQIINWNIEPEHLKNVKATGTKLYVKGSLRTLEPCLQGLQQSANDKYDGRFAVGEKQLKEMFTRFEPKAEIYWED